MTSSDNLQNIITDEKVHEQHPLYEEVLSAKQQSRSQENENLNTKLAKDHGQARKLKTLNHPMNPKVP